MRFGIFSHAPWPEGEDPRAIVEETTVEVQTAEALGFHSVWLAEHHFTRYSMASSPLLLLTHLAAKTSTIRLGSAVLIPPLHNPIRIAEDTATLDLLSSARLDVGFGRGTFGYEYAGFNAVPAESQGRFRETIAMVLGLWTTPDFSFCGRHYQASHVNLVPRPVQQPYPPVYIAATRTPATLDFLVSAGHCLCIAVVQDTDPALQLLGTFVQKSGIPASRVPFFRYVYVAETEEQAVRETRERLTWVIDIMQWRNALKAGSEVYQQMSEWRRTRTETPPSYEYLRANRAFIGTPDQVAARIQALRSRGVDYFGCNFDFGGLEHPKVLRSMELFAREVMPRFQ